MPHARGVEDPLKVMTRCAPSASRQRVKAAATATDRRRRDPESYQPRSRKRAKAWKARQIGRVATTPSASTEAMRVRVRRSTRLATSAPSASSHGRGDTCYRTIGRRIFVSRSLIASRTRIATPGYQRLLVAAIVWRNGCPPIRSVPQEMRYHGIAAHYSKSKRRSAAHPCPRLGGKGVQPQQCAGKIPAEFIENGKITDRLRRSMFTPRPNQRNCPRFHRGQTSYRQQNTTPARVGPAHVDQPRRLRRLPSC